MLGTHDIDLFLGKMPVFLFFCRYIFRLELQDNLVTEILHLCKLRPVPQHFIKEFHAARQISEVQIYIVDKDTVHPVLMMLQSVPDNPVRSALHFSQNSVNTGSYAICHCQNCRAFGTKAERLA